MGRVVGVICALPFGLAAVVLTWPQLFDLERTFPIAQIISFRGVLAAGFAILLALSLLVAIVRPLRAFSITLSLALLVATVGSAEALWTRGLGTDTLPDKTDASIRVMTWNTAGAATSADTVAQMAVAMEADIVTLPETTIQTGEQVAVAMRELGSPMWAHHTAYGEYGVDGWDATSTTLLITPRLGDYAIIESSQDGSSNTSTVPSAVAMPVDGTGPTVVAAHAVAPRPEYMERWNADLQWLADQCGEGNIILAGDFNATLDHMAGLGIGDATLGQCTDAAAATGNGGVGTWSTKIPALLGAPIDHVLVSEQWRATGSAVLKSLDDSGSDHRPLIVQLEPVG